jgi:urease accessory protein
MLVIEALEETDPGRRAATKGALSLARTVTLPFDKRRLSRQRLRLDDGDEAALFLPRGTVLAPGAILVATDGTRVEVVAAPELVSRVHSPDRRLLARAAYHLGNRHVPVQVDADALAYLHDHVLDDMLEHLGLTVEAVSAPFEPESGAYGAHGHATHHGHHSHEHAHEHAHDHDANDHDANDHDPGHHHGARGGA